MQVESHKTLKNIISIDHQKEIIKHNKVSNSDKNTNGEWERLFETSCKNYAD